MSLFWYIKRMSFFEQVLQENILRPESDMVMLWQVLKDTLKRV